MGLVNRIGSLFHRAVDRIGNLNVHAILNRVGAIASAGHKVVSLANVVTGGAVRQASDMLIGKSATNTVGKVGGYLASAYDTAMMTKAQMATQKNVGGNPAAGTQNYGQTNGGSMAPNVLWASKGK